jgi:hypothetical protein
MTIDNALASLAVKDLKAAATWYEKLFRHPADSTPMPEVMEWKFKVDRPVRRAMANDTRECAH